jgi:hypothetical protein
MWKEQVAKNANCREHEIHVTHSLTLFPFHHCVLITGFPSAGIRSFLKTGAKSNEIGIRALRPEIWAARK